MYNITIGRFQEDPQAQGVIRPEDGSWQLVIDKEGYPHLYVRVKDEDGVLGLLCIEDMMIGEGDISIPELMQSTFGGKLTSEEEESAMKEWEERKERLRIPCPKP
jgi:hypothetical protein